MLQRIIHGSSHFPKCTDTHGVSAAFIILQNDFFVNRNPRFFPILTCFFEPRKLRREFQFIACGYSTQKDVVPAPQHTNKILDVADAFLCANAGTPRGIGTVTVRARGTGESQLLGQLLRLIVHLG